MVETDLGFHALVKYVALLLGVTMGILGLSAAAQATELRVDVMGLRSGDGKIHLAVYDNAEDFPMGDRRLFETVVEAAADKVQIVLPDMAPGTYAIAAYHDENDNNGFDKGLFGVPLEGYAFSNDAAVFFGPPDFQDAAFAVNGDTVRITMTMVYW